MRHRFRDNMAGYAFIAPWLFCFLFFALIPVLLSLYYSLTDYDILSTPSFVGFTNYIYLLTEDPKFWKSVFNTFYYAFVSVPLKLLFAFFIAYLMSKRQRAVGFYRTAFYLPSIFGGSVAIAIVWRTIFGSGGTIQTILSSLGINTRYSMLGDPHAAMWVLIIMAVWQFGSPMLIFLAALKDIPVSYYESADIDGAGSFKKLIHITIPQITPIILFNFIMQMITGFLVFTQGYIITNSGPLNSTLFYVVQVYKTTFEYFEAGRGSAMAWMLLCFVGLLTAFIMKTSGKWVFYAGDQQ